MIRSISFLSLILRWENWHHVCSSTHALLFSRSIYIFGPLILVRNYKMKIHIIGAPGSGKSSIAVSLAQRFSMPALNFDDIYWANNSLCYGKKADVKKRDGQLREFISQKSWIIEGVYYKWVGESFKAADLIAILKVPVLVRDWRIIKRYVKRKLGLLPTKNMECALVSWGAAASGTKIAIQPTYVISSFAEIKARMISK